VGSTIPAISAAVCANSKANSLLALASAICASHKTKYILIFLRPPT
jgi:hypothetical protein